MYYQPAKDRANLTVLVGAHVCRINNRENENGKLTATGVDFLYQGSQYEVSCAREVCICAG